MKIYIASDHAGRNAKLMAAKALTTLGLEYIDLSKTNSPTDDYPDFAKKVAAKVQKEKALGILSCGTGIGMSIAANRLKGIRAAFCTTKKDAELARKHNDANILVLSGSYSHKHPQMNELIKTFFGTKFEGGRHLRRIKKIN